MLAGCSLALSLHTVCSACHLSVVLIMCGSSSSSSGSGRPAHVALHALVLSSISCAKVLLFSAWLLSSADVAHHRYADAVLEAVQQLGLLVSGQTPDKPGIDSDDGWGIFVFFCGIVAAVIGWAWYSSNRQSARFKVRGLHDVQRCHVFFAFFCMTRVHLIRRVGSLVCTCNSSVAGHMPQ
jgi:hypothetical protein